MDFAKSERYPNDEHIVNLSEIAALLKDAGIANVSVEQTGGGTATLYAGAIRIEDDREYYELAVGPGWFEPHWAAPNAQAFIVAGDSFYGQDNETGDNARETTGDAATIVRDCLAFLNPTSML